MDGNRVPHSKKSLIKDVKGNCDQGQRIDEGGQYSGAMVAKSLGGAGRASLDKYRDPRQQQSQQVGYVVAGFRKQSQTVGPNPGKERDKHIRKCGGKRIPQSPGAERSMRMRVSMGHKVQFTAE